VIVRTVNSALAAAVGIAAALGLLAVADGLRRGDVDSVPVVGAMLSKPDSFIPSIPIPLAPAAILAVLAFVLVQLLMRLLQVRGEHAAAESFRRWGGSGDLPANLSPGSRTRAARRATLAESARKTSGDLPEALGGASSIDAQKLGGSYGWLHVFGWALPVMGFVGTAMGMAKSIAGFQDALKDTTQANVVAERLAIEVIPGLASAFETTVLALVAALVTYLCTSALQQIDEEALQKLDDASLELIARTTVKQPDNTRAVLDSISKKLDALTALAKLSALDQILAKLTEIAKLPDRAENAVKGLTEAVTELRAGALEVRNAGAAMKEGAKGVEEATKELRAAAKAPYTVRIERG